MPNTESTLDLGALGPCKVDCEYSLDTAGDVYILHVWGAPYGCRVDLYPLITEWAIDELLEGCQESWKNACAAD